MKINAERYENTRRISDGTCVNFLRETGIGG
jgi:hypothetical protein